MMTLLPRISLSSSLLALLLPKLQHSLAHCQCEMSLHNSSRSVKVIMSQYTYIHLLSMNNVVCWSCQHSFASGQRLVTRSSARYTLEKVVGCCTACMISAYHHLLVAMPPTRTRDIWTHLLPTIESIQNPLGPFFQSDDNVYEVRVKSSLHERDKTGNIQKRSRFQHCLPPTRRGNAPSQSNWHS